MLLKKILIWVFWSQNVGPGWVKNGKVAKGMRAIFQKKGKKGQKDVKKLFENQGKNLLNLKIF